MVNGVLSHSSAAFVAEISYTSGLPNSSREATAMAAVHADDLLDAAAGFWAKTGFKV